MTAIAERFPEVFALPKDQRVAEGHALIESADAETEADDLPPAFIEELQCRVAEHRADPSTAIPWEVVKAHLLARSKK